MKLATTDRVAVRDRMNFYAPGELGATRRVTPEGFLVCEGVAIARTGQQRYLSTELPLDADGDGGIIVDRLPDEVFREETIASFEGKPVTVEHPNEFVTPESWKDKAVGVIQNVRRGTGIEDDLLLADLLITHADAIAYVNRDMPELSCGYDSDYEQTEPGKAIQRNIIGNHVALVDRGRAGPRCAIKDNSTGDDFMPKVKGSVTRSFMRMLAAFHNKDEKGVAAELEKIEDDEPDEAEMLDSEIKSQFKEMYDWMKDCQAKDAAEEEKKKQEAKDAAEEEEKKKKEAEDAVLNAEVLPKLADLGKVYTGDSAKDAPIKEIFSRGEILAPGISLPTADGLKTDGALSAFMHKALATADGTDAGKECIQPFLMGRSLKVLTGDALLGVFNGAAELMRVRNNRSTAPTSLTTRDFGKKPPDNAELNKLARERWAKK